LRHLDLKGLFDILATSKRKMKLSLPTPPCNVVPLFELHVSVGTTNTSSLKGGDGEGVVLGEGKGQGQFNYPIVYLHT